MNALEVAAFPALDSKEEQLKLNKNYSLSKEAWRPNQDKKHFRMLRRSCIQ